MKIFFDTEFTGLVKNTTLISIGLVDEEDNTFYAEFNDFDRSLVDDWIQNNVINKCKFIDQQDIFEFKHTKNSSNVEVYGDRSYVKTHLRAWLLSRGYEIEWVSDVCHYDFVLLIDLLYGTALDIPPGICIACHDINQDIANYYGGMDIDEIKASNLSREEIIKDNNIIVTGDKHNSLYDAKVIKEIYSIIKG